MNFYYFILKQYRPAYLQLVCIAAFLGLLSPAAVIIFLIRQNSDLLFQGLVFLSGWVTWTFAEYILHRFWMHSGNSRSAMAQTHHHHHTHPTELAVTHRHRLGMFAVLCVLVIMAIYLNGYFSFLAGVCFGVEGYFLMHRFLHLKMGQRVFKRLVRYHIYHHCKYPHTCFGVSVPWWDDLFKTVPKEPKISQRIIDFYFNEPKEKALPNVLNTTTAGKNNPCGMAFCNDSCEKPGSIINTSV